jgi:tetratricopeptide (TPR) repeat protein
MYSGEWERRVRLSDEALAIARRLGDPDALSTVLNMRFVTLLAPDTLEERRSNTVEAVEAAERLSDPLIRFYAYHWRTYACIEAGDVLGAHSWATRERDIADRFRHPTTVWLRRADEANFAIIAGRLDQAAQLATAALEIGQQSEPDAIACHAAQQTSIAFERGNLGEFVPLLEDAVRDNPGVPGFRAVLALALTEASRKDEARRLVAQAMASSFSDLPYDVAWLAVACIYSEVSFRLGDTAAAAALYRMLEPWSEQIAFPAFGVWGPVRLHLGSLALLRGDIAAAERHLMEAGRTSIRAGAPLWEQRATERLEQVAQIAQ